MAGWGDEFVQGLFMPLSTDTRVSRLTLRSESNRRQSGARGSRGSAGSLKPQEPSTCNAFSVADVLELQNSHLKMRLGGLDLLTCVARGMSEWQTSASTAFCLFYNSAQNFGAL